MPRADDLTAFPWVTVFAGELIEAQSLESGLQAYGFRTNLREATAENGDFELQVRSPDAEAVHRFVAERWQEDQRQVTPVEENQVERVQAMGRRVRYVAFWMPIIVFGPAVSYLTLSSTLPVRPHQHGMSLAASWFAVVATLSIAGAGVYALAR